MITVFNTSNYAQQVFFNKAFALLKSSGKLNADELQAGRFLSIDGYFAHMNDLVSTDSSYALIPSDEQPFEIDANSRTIKVPAAFSKCSGVVGDNMCEIITFTVDRYFDYVDLANTNICVLWELGNGEKGISHIGLRDLETVSGKIRFGWPLTSELTKHAGNISFSVQFFISKTVEDEIEGEKKQFVYLLNTLPAIIPIKKGLEVSGDNVIIEESVVDLFKDFVSNSNNPSYPIPSEVKYFANLPAQAKIDEETNTLQFKIQANAADKGYVKYKWYIKEGVYDKGDLTIVPSEITNELICEEDGIVPFEIRDSFESVGSDYSKLNKFEKTYYMNTGSDEAASYVPVLVNENNEFTSPDGEVLNNVELFERFSILTILPTDCKEVTGLYYATAWNEVGPQEFDVNGESVGAINKTNPLQSTQCYVPTPAELVVTEELLQDKFIDEKTGEAIVKFVLEADSGNPQRTYTWYKSEDELDKDEDGKWTLGTSGSEMVESDINAAQLATAEPGWYYVHVNSLLNRATTEITSDICRIVNNPVKPELVEMKYNRWADIDKDNGEFIEGRGWNDYTGEVETLEKGDIVRLQIEMTPINSKLESDSITYEWHEILEGGVDEKVEESMKDSNGTIHENAVLGTNYLDVRLNENGTYQKYYCKVINTLVDKSTSFDRDDYSIMFTIH